MTEQTVTRSTTHSTFVIERALPHPPQRVYQAFADKAGKRKWFVGPEEHTQGEHEFDFREGGRESISGGAEGGEVYTYRATYHDIVPGERIISAYDMYAGDTRISVSIASVEFRPDGDGTLLVFTEQGAFLDGHDTVESREHGTRALLDNLAASLGN